MDGLILYTHAENVFVCVTRWLFRADFWVTEYAEALRPAVEAL